MTDLDDKTRELVTNLAQVNAKIADLNVHAEAIKAQLRDLTPDDYTIGGKPALRIAPTRRFDVDQAARAIASDQDRQACLIVKYDPTAVKRHLTPEQTEQYMVDAGKAKVTLL